jgi:hypothetical protein
MATAELAGRARQGDGNAFGIRMDPYRRELHVHRYRILGSAAGAEDVLQERMLAAWPGIGGFGEWASSLAFITALPRLPFDNSSLARFGERSSPRAPRPGSKPGSAPPAVEIRPGERDTLDAMSRVPERFAAPATRPETTSNSNAKPM